MKIPFSYCENQYINKPSDDVIKLLRFKPTLLPLPGIMNLIEQGHPWLCGQFQNNRRKKSHFIKQQLFAVDFDKSITIQEATNMLEEYGLQYHFGYYTLSHTDALPRFRLVFLMDGEVHDKDLVHDINDSLWKFFDEQSDANAKDVPRLWWGSNQKCFLGKQVEPFNLFDFVTKLDLKRFINDRNQSRYCIGTGNIESKLWGVEDIVGINMNEIGAETGNAIIYTYKINRICTKNEHDGHKSSDTAPIDNWKVEELLECELFRRFINGVGSEKPDKLGHHELFGIATNLAPLRGGEKLYKDTIRKYRQYDSSKQSIISFIKDMEFTPHPFKSFSPYECDQNNSYQTFPQLLKKRGKVKILKQPNLMTLQEAEQMLAEAFQRITTTDDKKIYVMLCAPGLGKTEFIKNMNKVVVAFPDHALKEEQFHTSNLPEDKRIMTPNIKKRFSGEIEKYFDSLYALNLGNNVMIKLRELSEGKYISVDQTDGDVEAAKKYLNQMDEAVLSLEDTTIFTTHQRALHIGWLHDTIIYDEDPIKSILEQHTAKVSELETLLGYLMVKNQNTDTLTQTLSEPDFDTPKPTPRFSIDNAIVKEICADKRFTSHVLSFFKSDVYYKENGHIHFCVNHKDKFNKNRKYIICDATASPEVYRGIFGDRLEVIDLSNVVFKGTLNQYTNCSFSKTGFKRYGKKLKIDSSLPTITFKDQKQAVPNAAQDVHFGRVRGTNVYSGKNINVVGTFHYNSSHYRFLSNAIGIINEEWETKVREVSYKGLQFMFSTYAHPTLQRLHLETVEGELVQAVHRPRLIRTDATVNLYSNFPLAQANYFF